jgi:hypothetical protein
MPAFQVDFVELMQKLRQKYIEESRLIFEIMKAQQRIRFQYIVIDDENLIYLDTNLN